MKKLKAISSILVFCLVVSLSATSWAATALEVKEAEVRQLLQNSMRQTEIIRILKMNSSEAKQNLLKVTEELHQLKQELNELKKAHEQLTISYNKMMNYSQNQEDSLKKINESFEAYSKETKSKIKNLELQRTGLLVVVGALVIKAFIK